MAVTRYPKRDMSGPYIGWGALDGNHHGPKVDGETTVLRSTAQIAYLDNGLMPPPRFNWGVRLWVYAPSGRCWNLDLGWRSLRRYAESDAERARRAAAYVEQQKAQADWPPAGPMGPDWLAAMLGAHGLGLTVTEVPAPTPMRHRCATCSTVDGHEPGCPENEAPPEADMLPDGLWERDGRLYFECRSCGRATEWPEDPADFQLAEPGNVCGRSPWCLP